MSRKIFIIDDCEDCPYVEFSREGNGTFTCGKTGDNLNGVHGIPESCPLDEYVESVSTSDDEEQSELQFIDEMTDKYSSFFYPKEP